MDRPVRKRLPHAVPQWVADTDPFFITINCEPRGQNHLCRAGLGYDVLSAAKINNERGIWNCRLMLLMPDHLHAVIVFSKNVGLKTAVANWKKYLARTNGIQWQKDFFDHRLRNHTELLEKVDYILMNPVRRGLCERAEDWQWIFRAEIR
jgi:putative transposase